MADDMADFRRQGITFNDYKNPVPDNVPDPGVIETGTEEVWK